MSEEKEGFLDRVFDSSQIPRFSDLPKYVECSNDVVLPPPYIFEDTLMYNFFFRSNSISSLQAILDQRLNLPGNDVCKYEIFSPLIMVTFANIKKGRSIPRSYMGYDIENELLFWLLAVEKIKNRRGEWVSNRLVWFIPYAVVDNFWAVTAGREVYGFPKVFGSCNIPQDHNNAFSFKSSIEGFSQYSVNTLLQVLPFVSIEKESKVSDFKPWTSAKEIGRDLRQIIIGEEQLEKDISPRFCWNEMEDLLHMEFEWVFLKQFRDVAQPDRACYQAVVESIFKLQTDNIRGGLWISPFRLTINDIESSPVGKELGLVNGQKSRAAFWLRVDFGLKEGKVLWKAQ